MIESLGFSWFSSDDTGMHEEGTDGGGGRTRQAELDSRGTAESFVGVSGGFCPFG